MYDKWSPKDNIKNETRRLSLQLPAFWFTCLVVWIFIFKQVMHFSVIITVLYTSASHMPTQGSPVPTTPQPAFNIPVSQPDQERFGSFPQFLSVHQLVDVLEGSTAVLECKLANLGIQHTVSWMRSSDMSVLTVGGLVFSSDPRIGVVSSTRPGQAAGTWSLQIAEAALRDSGEYQCQVNSEPKESLDVTLRVRGDDDELIDQNADKEIYSVFKHINIPDPTKHDLNIPNISDSETSPISQHEEIELELKTNAESIVDKPEKITTTEIVPSPTSYDLYHQVRNIIMKARRPETSEPIPEPHPSTTVLDEKVNNFITDTTKASKLGVIIPTTEPHPTINDFDEEVNASKPAIIGAINVPVPEPHPTANDGSAKDNPEITSSLLIPILSLSLVALLIIILGSIRLFYSRYVNTKPPPGRSRSATRTSDSRRSSGSRSSDDSVYNSKRMRRKARELELERERMMIYDEIRHKARLSPLKEMIKPTPPLFRRSPIFMMTSLELPGISDESEYEADRSDVTGNTKITEDENLKDYDNVAISDHTCSASEDLVEDVPKVTSYYETLKNKIQKFLGEHELDQPQGEEGDEDRIARTKLVDNVNTFL